jgi:metal-responsive CopG/Arc/MetJ family transcriptional regulator
MQMGKHASDQQLIHMFLGKPLLKRLDDFRVKHGFPSRTEAVRWLLDWALKQKPEPPKPGR